MATISPLRQRMIEDMSIRNLAPATQQSSLYAVARFSRHFNCPPDRLGMEQVRVYQVHLVDQKHSWNHINQVACALRFFYGITLGQKEAIERIVYGREPEKLPPFLSSEELIMSGFVAQYGPRVSWPTLRNASGTLRVFLRYLHREGVTIKDLSPLVQFPQSYRHAGVPRSISWEQVEQVLVDFATISQWLGHASLNTTMRYARADLDLKRQALAQVFPDVLAPPKNGAFAFHGNDLTGWLRRL